MMPGHNLEEVGDIDELISLKQMVLITLKNKIKCLMKYSLQRLYLENDLLSLIEQTSKSLSLLNLVDRNLGIKIWYETFDSALSTYFFYFLFSNKDIFNRWSWTKSAEHPKIIQFQQEVDRLVAFFGTFVKGKYLEQVSLRYKMIIEYFKSSDTQAAIGYLRSLITTGSIKSYYSLVFSCLITEKCYENQKDSN